MKYKAIIFDLFGTLVDKFPVDESIDVLREMAVVLSVPADNFIQLWFDTFDERHYKVGLISNWSDEVPTVWQDIPLSRYFDVSVFSCKAGMMKPDPRIYRMAVEQLSVEPSDCLYIGDDDSRELAGASEVGMHAVLIGGKSGDTPIGDEEREEWTGRIISSLEEVMDILG